MIDKLKAILSETNEFSETDKSIILDQCPYCGKSKKLYIVKEAYSNGSKVFKAGRWVCFRCGEYGRPERLVAELKGIEEYDARQLLGESNYNLDWEPPPPAIKIEEPLPFIDFPVGCIDPMSVEGVDGALYLMSRGVSNEAASLYGLKYNPANRRVYIPINHGPYMVGWQARLIDSDPKKKKVLFPKGIPAKRVLMGYNQAEEGLAAANGQGALCIVEGPFDMLKATAYGLIFGLATMGKNYGMHQIEEIAKLSKRYSAPVYVGYDPDAFETGQAQSLCNELLSRGVKVLVFKEIPGEDIGGLVGTEIDSLYDSSNVIRYDMGVL